MEHSQLPDTRAIYRADLDIAVQAGRSDLLDLTLALLSTPSEHPPGDVRAVAEVIRGAACGVDGLEVETYATLPHVQNVVLRVRGARPGRRLVFNGHLDTFPLVDPAAWTADPRGEVRDGMVYGLGVGDMKGGVAVIVSTLRQLAGVRHALAGEVVATLVGDEESMGEEGSQYLLDHVPGSQGDAMISADTGSTRVLRFGEKGLLWLSLRAAGHSAHAAHVHRGDCAIEKLVAAMQALTSLRQMTVNAPAAVVHAMDRASSASESVSGAGESDVLRAVTVTFGTMRGGQLPNLIAAQAEATVDIRVPVGLSLADVEQAVRDRLGDHPGVQWQVERRYEPSWTPPDHEVMRRLADNTETVTGIRPAINMRVGASDARLYRRAGVPTATCGLAAHNMGNADEHVTVDELQALARIYALTAFDYLGQ